MALNSVLMNFGFLVFGVTDYVTKIHTAHYGAVIAKKPRNQEDKDVCCRLGRRLAEWVAVYVDGRRESHPLLTTKAADREIDEKVGNYGAGCNLSTPENGGRPVHLVVSITVPKANQEAWRDKVTELTKASRSELGCCEYYFVKVDGEEEEFRVVEKWASQAALDAHNASEHFTRLVPEMGTISTTTKVLKCHEI
jgi:quinol monooxygenase YgiN